MAPQVRSQRKGRDLPCHDLPPTSEGHETQPSKSTPASGEKGQSDWPAQEHGVILLASPSEGKWVADFKGSRHRIIGHWRKPAKHPSLGWPAFHDSNEWVRDLYHCGRECDKERGPFSHKLLPGWEDNFNSRVLLLLYFRGKNNSLFWNCDPPKLKKYLNYTF